MSISRNDWKKSETVKFFILGYSQERISNELKISIGSVNSIITEALSHDKTLELQRQIAILVNKNKTTLKQIAANVRWKNAVKLRGLDENKIEKMLDLMDIIFNKNNVPPGTASELLYSSIEYLLKNDLDPERLQEDIRIKKSELELIIDDIKINNDTLEKSKSNLESQLAKSRLTQKTLNTLSHLFKALDLYNLELSDLLQLPRVIEEFKKLGWDAKTIVTKYEQVVDLEASIRKQESRTKRYEAVLDDLYDKITEQKRKWGNYNHAFQTFNKLVESGIKPDEIFKVSYILKNNFTQETASQLVEDIEKYGSIAASRLRLERNYVKEYGEDSSLETHINRNQYYSSL